MAFLFERARGVHHGRRDRPPIVCLDFPLRPPEGAIEPGEMPTSIVALTVIRGVFARDSSSASQAASVLLDAILGLLTGRGRKN